MQHNNLFAYSFFPIYRILYDISSLFTIFGAGNRLADDVHAFIHVPNLSMAVAFIREYSISQ